jgi:homoserine kinase
MTERVKGESVVTEGAAEIAGARGRAFEVRVPASTSNLGAGFDCFGLALQLYLTVRATVLPTSDEACRVRSRGEGQREGALSRTADNLIYRAMLFAAEHEGLALPPLRLAVHNELPLSRGLGSSAAAIVAGIKLCSSVCDKNISDEEVLRYAFEMEGHADNVAAALYGGWVVTCVKSDANVIAIKRHWPSELKVVAVSPSTPLKTSLARARLPRTVELVDAVNNLQRVALFSAAIETGADELLWEAMQDHLHQAHRQSLIPGLTEALATPSQPGLVGLALSGSGPSVIALARDHFSEIGEAIANSFQRHGAETTVRLLEVDQEGIKTKRLR